jgi:ketosteroid isomerase-like protein
VESQTDLASSARHAPAPVDVVTNFVEAWNAKDFGALAALLAPQLSGHSPLAGGQMMVAAKELVVGGVERAMSVFRDLHWEVKGVISGGDGVAVEMIESATLIRTNTSYAMPFSGVFRVNADGLITQFHSYWDTGTFFQQLDVSLETFGQILALPD